MSETRFYHIQKNEKPEQFKTVQETLEAAKAEGFVWLDYQHPTKEELSALIEPLGLHPLSVEDCLDSNQVPKIEDFPSNVFIIFNALSYSDRTLSVDEVDFFVGSNFLVTVSGGTDARIPPPFSDVNHVLEQNLEHISQGPAYLMHTLLDRIVDDKFLAIEALEEDLDQTEEKMVNDPSSFSPADMLGIRRDLISLRKSLFHEREILVKICREDYPLISGKVIFHYRDIYDHLTRFFELTEGYRDIVTSLMELYASMLSNVMAKIANDQNNTMKRLTFIATIFMPLTLLASIGGMSEWTMMTGAHNWKIAYPAFVAGMVVIGLLTHLFLRRVDK